MRILLVEDKLDQVLVLKERLLALNPDIEIVHAASRDSAKLKIKEGMYDLIICDLSIPTSDGGLDENRSHGLDVYEYARVHSAGTMCMLLSAFLDIDLIDDALRMAPTGDEFGVGPERPLLRAIEKKNLDKVIEGVRRMSQVVRDLADIEIIPEADCALEVGQKRVLRIFARVVDGHSVRVRSVSGGMSSARPVLLKVNGEHDEVRCVAFAKMGAIPDMRDEQQKGRLHVASLLPVGSFVSDLRIVSAGAGPLGGVFYPFAEEHSESLYARLKAHPEGAEALIRLLRAVESRWQSDAVANRLTVADVRRACVSDADFPELSARCPEWRLEDLDLRHVQVNRCVQHGDLHGENILLRPDGSPLLIDYARAGPAPAALDPLTLELSLLFHPIGRELSGGWPDVATARNWRNIEQYVVGCPIAQFVRSCRAWATEVAYSQRETSAVAYAIALRQLKFRDTNKDVAKAIMESAISGIRET